jgi:thiamine pyrophosphokinase
MSVTIVNHTDAVALWGAAMITPVLINIVQTKAVCHVAADGGADRLYDADIAPAAVIGDLDSLSDQSRVAFADLLYPSSDQNTTDFQKAVRAINAPLILAVGFLGGRLDHTFAVLNTLIQERLGHVILLSEDDVCFCAPQGEFELKLPPTTRVGLLPMGAARVETKGLRWDIKDAAMATDGFMSTSNETVSEVLHMHVMGRLLITLPLSTLDAVISAVRAE